ncbi:MAG: LysE family translocator [Xanthomonadaceae bacterium]|nr:LysE family translocator [Xanthomonadaceae bacterium]
MDISILAGFILAASLYIVSPGPIALFSINTAINHSKRGLFFAICGTTAAALIWIGCAALLISGIGSVNPNLLNYLAIFGALFMLGYGYSLIHPYIMHRRNPDKKETAEMEAESSDTTYHRLFLKGVILGMANPKDLIFFMAFFPPFLANLGLSHLHGMTLLTLIWCALDFTVLISLGLGVRHLITPKVEKVLILLSSALFIGVGLYALIKTILGMI